MPKDAVWVRELPNLGHQRYLVGGHWSAGDHISDPWGAQVPLWNQALILPCQTPQLKHLCLDQFSVTQRARKRNLPPTRAFSSLWINAYYCVWHQWELCQRSRAVNGLMERIIMLSCVHTTSHPSCGYKDLPLGELTGHNAHPQLIHIC